MSTEPTVEQRLAALERAVTDLQHQLAAQPPAGNWLERIVGSFKDKPAFDEVLEYGRAFREADLNTHIPHLRLKVLRRLGGRSNSWRRRR
jgi:hypothetical protein